VKNLWHKLANAFGIQKESSNQPPPFFITLEVEVVDHAKKAIYFASGCGFLVGKYCITTRHIFPKIFPCHQGLQDAFVRLYDYRGQYFLTLSNDKLSKIIFNDFHDIAALNLGKKFYRKKVKFIKAASLKIPVTIFRYDLINRQLTQIFSSTIEYSLSREFLFLMPSPIQPGFSGSPVLTANNTITGMILGNHRISKAGIALSSQVIASFLKSLP